MNKFIANPENHKRKLVDEWINNHTESVGFGMKLEDTTGVNPWSFIKIMFFLISLLLFVYVLPAGPEFPPIPPQSVQSKEPADTETLLRRAYFTNLNRQEVIEWYKNQFNRGYKIYTPRLNYPPEEAQIIIRDQTRSTYLEEIVHPLRESLFINGFEPKTEKDTIIIDGVNWRQKIIIRYIPSNVYLRLIVVSLTIASALVLMREYYYVKK